MFDLRTSCTAGDSPAAWGQQAPPGQTVGNAAGPNGVPISSNPDFGSQCSALAGGGFTTPAQMLVLVSLQETGSITIQTQSVAGIIPPAFDLVGTITLKSPLFKGAAKVSPVQPSAVPQRQLEGITADVSGDTVRFTLTDSRIDFPGPAGDEPVGPMQTSFWQVVSDATHCTFGLDARVDMQSATVAASVELRALAEQACTCSKWIHVFARCIRYLPAVCVCAGTRSESLRCWWQVLRRWKPQGRRHMQVRTNTCLALFPTGSEGR
jgi:hypothetical protein